MAEQTPPKEDGNVRDSNRGNQTTGTPTATEPGNGNSVSNKGGFPEFDKFLDSIGDRDFKAEHIEAKRNRTEERREEIRGSQTGDSGSTGTANKSGSGSTQRARKSSAGETPEKPNVIEKPNTVSERKPSETGKPVQKKSAKPEPALASEDAIRDIVSQGIRAAFLGIGAFTKPPELVPAWDLSEEMVARPTECFSRTLKRLTPEQAELVQKYGDPILGCWELFSLYRIVLGRENELRAYYSELSTGTAQQKNGTDRVTSESIKSDRQPASGPGDPKGYPTSGIVFP